MIELKNVSFSYDSNELLSDVNLTIARNDYWGIVGPNGCGKSTLLKIILRLIKPDSGEVIYRKEGKEVPALTMGYVPQSSQIDKMFPITVREVVALGLIGEKKSASDAVEEVMRQMDIYVIADKPIGALSGGELQRTLMARAVVSRPDVLVLDEPDTYLDKKSVDTLYSLLSSLNSDCTVLVVSHNESRIKEYASHIAYVEGTVNCCRNDR